MMAEHFSTTGPLVLALVVFGGGLALWVRNVLRQRYADELAALAERTRPWLKTAAGFLFIITLVLWVAIFVTAPETSPDGAGDDIRKLFTMPDPQRPPPDGKAN